MRDGAKFKLTPLVKSSRSWNRSKDVWRPTRPKRCRRRWFIFKVPGANGLWPRPAEGRTVGQWRHGIHLSAVSVPLQRTGQFWNQSGDEALLCQETFRRNGCWHLLFPHSTETPPKTDLCPPANLSNLIIYSVEILSHNCPTVSWKQLKTICATSRLMGNVALKMKAKLMKTRKHHTLSALTTLLGIITLLLQPLTATAQTANRVLTFDGLHAYMNIPNAPDLQNPTEITIEAWLNPDPTGNRRQCFLCKSDGVNQSSFRSYEMIWYSYGGDTGPGNRIEVSFS